MIHFTCIHCLTRLNVPDDKAGQAGKCPKCGQTIHAPAAKPENDHAPAMPPANAMKRADVDEIPLADEPPRAKTAEPARQHQPRQPARGPILPPDDGDDADIPLADEPAAGAKDTPQPEPPPTPGGLIITPAGDAIVVSFQNSKILDPVTIETIGRELYALVDERGCRKIALDFANVNFLSSQMLGVLIALQKKVAGKKGRLLLCAVHSDLQKVFHIVKLERILPIVADRHTALGVLGLP